MNPNLRNVLVVLCGVVLCMILNGMLLSAMMKILAPPAGFRPDDVSTYDLLGAKHMLSPFIAHSLPSLIGGFVAASFAASRKMAMALVVGGVHLLGGIAAAVMIPAPAWFEVLDLTLAYLPMAWIGAKLARA
jgi:hypothetical protein